MPMRAAARIRLDYKVAGGARQAIHAASRRLNYPQSLPSRLRRVDEKAAKIFLGLGGAAA